MTEILRRALEEARANTPAMVLALSREDATHLRRMVAAWNRDRAARCLGPLSVDIVVTLALRGAAEFLDS